MGIHKAIIFDEDGKGAQITKIKPLKPSFSIDEQEYKIKLEDQTTITYRPFIRRHTLYFYMKGIVEPLKVKQSQFKSVNIPPEEFYIQLKTKIGKQFNDLQKGNMFGDINITYIIIGVAIIGAILFAIY